MSDVQLWPVPNLLGMFVDALHVIVQHSLEIGSWKWTNQNARIWEWKGREERDTWLSHDCHVRIAMLSTTHACVPRALSYTLIALNSHLTMKMKGVTWLILNMIVQSMSHHTYTNSIVTYSVTVSFLTHMTVMWWVLCNCHTYQGHPRGGRKHGWMWAVAVSGPGR